MSKTINTSKEDILLRFIKIDKDSDLTHALQKYSNSRELLQLASDDLELLGKELIERGFAKYCLLFFRNYFNHHKPTTTSFHSYFLQGLAAMLSEELEQALDFFKHCHNIEPQEIAPVVNIAKILQAIGLHRDSLEWAQLGMEIDPNNFKLVELIYLYSKEFLKELTFAKQAVEKYQSWALGILIEMSESKDEESAKKNTLTLLKRFYEKGERGDAFLIQYTAYLGEVDQFDRILEICWEANIHVSGGLSWKLECHKAQALIALGKKEEVLKVIQILEKRNDIPPEELNNLQSLCLES